MPARKVAICFRGGVGYTHQNKVNFESLPHLADWIGQVADWRTLNRTG